MNVEAKEFCKLDDDKTISLKMNQQQGKYVCGICSKSLSCRRSLYRHKKSCVSRSSSVEAKEICKLDDDKKPPSSLVIDKCDKCCKVFRLCRACTTDEAST